MKSPVITVGRDGKKYLLSYGTKKDNGCCSNFYESEFSYGSTSFHTVEQYFQYMKANTFGDLVKMNEILEAETSAEAKRLGRKVSGFNRVRWDENKYNIMYLGVKAKFTQNEALRDWLKSVDADFIAECSPSDTTWGIGVYSYDECAADFDRWRGENLLGKILMSVKKEL